MGNESWLPDAKKNLQGVSCPMNMVYAKAELARLKQGQLLELILDDGIAVANVSQSIAREGHSLLKKAQLPDGSWALLIRRS
ncbi:MAG: sulfurtransferase TusA family protein [Desulfobulbaceae bacterium]|nr:sulfurtransferase TusA family protein [Desulfobulbaceae bacterium]